MVEDLLFRMYPKEEDAFLNEERERLVSNNNLARIGAELKLDRFIFMSLGETRNFLGEGHTKILAKVVEAVIGAIFLDSKTNYVSVRRVVAEWMNFVQYVPKKRQRKPKREDTRSNETVTPMEPNTIEAEEIQVEEEEEIQTVTERFRSFFNWKT